MKLSHTLRTTGFLIVCTAPVLAANSPMKLTSRVLHYIDGKAHALDGVTIMSMKKITFDIRRVLFGKLDPVTKSRTGLFELQNKKVSLHTLTRIEERIIAKYQADRDALEHEYIDMTRFRKEWMQREQDLMQEYEEQLLRIEEEMMTRHADDVQRYVAIKKEQRAVMRKHNALVTQETEALKQEHITNFAAFTEKLAALEHKREQQLALLHPALQVAKKTFENITLPFMVQARGSKAFMVPLIEEWADKAGHKDSMLLRWSEEVDGTEMKMFEHDITSCRALNSMCSDLINFIEVLMNSCPKAQQQYEALKKDIMTLPHE